MKIFGIGTDIVNIKRMKKILKGKNNKFKKRVFSKEIDSSCYKYPTKTSIKGLVQ